MIFCCGLFRVVETDDETHIEYRPYKYRMKLMDEEEKQRTNSAIVIQRTFSKRQIRSKKQELHDSLQDMEIMCDKSKASITRMQASETELNKMFDKK